MRLELTLEQYNEIEKELPLGISICFQDNFNYYLDTNSSELIYDKLELALDSLYSMTVEEFFASLPRKYKMAALREKGQEISDKFIERNLDDGISDEQSRWVLSKASTVTMYLLVGALGDAVAALHEMPLDDMTEEYHWITQERIQKVIEDINTAYQEV
jgi:hypothetical protein